MRQGGIHLRAEGVSRRLGERARTHITSSRAFGRQREEDVMAFDREPGDEMDDFGDEISSDYQEEEGAESEESVGDDDEDISYEEVMVAGTTEVSPAEEPAEVVAPTPPAPAPA